MKVFVTRIIAAAGVKMLEDAGLTITQWKEKRELSPEELTAICKEHDGLLCVGRSKLDRQFLRDCSHLKVISLHSAGYDNIDLEEATNLGIKVGNTPGVLSGATADTAFLLMLAVSRKAFFHHKRILNSEWNFFEPTKNLGIELYGKTLGVYGLGKIGYEMAKRCVGAYDMKVIYCNRSVNERAESELGAVKVSFDEMLTESDVLSVHTVLTDETRGVFNKDAFNKMKPSSIFINTARGAIHVEKDIEHALCNGLIWGAGLDVTDPEPMTADNPLLDMPNVAVLPHIGSATAETRNAMAKLAAENIIAGLQEKRLPYGLNFC